MQEVLTPTREIIDGIYYCIHVSKDGRIRINSGPDDQKPDHDGVMYFMPLCVAQHLDAKSDSVYTYVKYCGRCRKRMGSLGEIKECCPRCGSVIAHYIFAMGIIHWRPESWSDELPDQLPDFSSDSRYTSDLEAAKLLSAGTAKDRESSGKLLLTGG